MTVTITFDSGAEAQSFAEDLWDIIHHPNERDSDDVTTTYGRVDGSTLELPERSDLVGFTRTTIPAADASRGKPGIGTDADDTGFTYNQWEMSRFIKNWEGYLVSPSDFWIRICDTGGHFPANTAFDTMTMTEFAALFETTEKAIPDNREFESFLRPFKADSPWNRYPVNPVLKPVTELKIWSSTDRNEARAAGYTQALRAPFDFHAFLSSGTPLSWMRPEYSTERIWKNDTNNKENSLKSNYITSFNMELPLAQRPDYYDVEKIPPTAQGTPNSDGWFSVADLDNNRIWSFWQFRNDKYLQSDFVPSNCQWDDPSEGFPLCSADGKFRATSLDWGALDGTGWALPGHYRNGARATAISDVCGVVRGFEHYGTEGDTSADMYDHVISMQGSLLQLKGYGCNLIEDYYGSNTDDRDNNYRYLRQYNGLFNGKIYETHDFGYKQPCTDADSGWNGSEGYNRSNYGAAAYGELWLLDPSLDVDATFEHEWVRKVARTAQKYGVIFVDKTQAEGSFNIEAGIHTDYRSSNDLFELNTNSAVDPRGNYWSDFSLFLDNLRLMESCDYWIDGNGNETQENYKPERYWFRISGSYNANSASDPSEYDYPVLGPATWTGRGTHFSITGERNHRALPWDPVLRQRRFIWDAGTLSANSEMRLTVTSVAGYGVTSGTTGFMGPNEKTIIKFCHKMPDGSDPENDWGKDAIELLWRTQGVSDPNTETVTMDMSLIDFPGTAGEGVLPPFWSQDTD